MSIVGPNQAIEPLLKAKIERHVRLIFPECTEFSISDRTDEKGCALVTAMSRGPYKFTIQAGSLVRIGDLE